MKIRCHVSIIFEECATFIVSALVLAFLNIGEMFGDDSMTGSDALYGALALAGLIFVLLLSRMFQKQRVVPKIKSWQSI